MNERTSTSPTSSISGSQSGRSNCFRRPARVRVVGMTGSLSGKLSRNKTSLRQKCDFCAGGANSRTARLLDGMTQRTASAGLTELVEALVEAACPIAIVLGDMAHAPVQPDPDEARAVLAAVLYDALQPLGAILADRDLNTTTAVLEAIAPLAMEKLYVVHQPPPPARPRRDPRASHRAPLRRRNRRLRNQP